MKKIVVNQCFGGFSLSHAGVMAYAAKKGITLYPFVEDPSDNDKFIPDDGSDKANGWGVHYATKPLSENGNYEKGSYFSHRNISRDDPALVSVVEELGDAANGMCAKLGITEIPDDANWQIEEYDGSEHVAECHRTW